jgi:hypothetical protein
MEEAPASKRARVEEPSDAGLGLSEGDDEGELGYGFDDQVEEENDDEPVPGVTAATRPFSVKEMVALRALREREHWESEDPTTLNRLHAAHQREAIQKMYPHIADMTHQDAFECWLATMEEAVRGRNLRLARFVRDCIRYEMSCWCYAFGKPVHIREELVCHLDHTKPQWPAEQFTAERFVLWRRTVRALRAHVCRELLVDFAEEAHAAILEVTEPGPVELTDLIMSYLIPKPENRHK